MDLIEVYRYIVDTVVDVVFIGAVLLLPHAGLKPETFKLSRAAFLFIARTNFSNETQNMQTKTNKILFLATTDLCPNLQFMISVRSM